ncbi:MAG: hypothetical protein R3B07_19025 [Polyangiaceae bacterium]
MWKLVLVYAQNQRLPLSSPRCSVAHECGGCPWIAEDVALQRGRKLESLRTQLEMHGLDFPEPSFSAAGSELGYRNRLRLRVDETGAAVFFNPNKLTNCAVLDSRLANAVALLQALGPQPGLAGAEHLELRVGDDGSVGLCVYAAVESQVAGGVAKRAALRSALPAEWQLGFAGEGELPSLPYYLEESLQAGLGYQVPLSSFVQVNSAVCRALVQELRGLVREARLEAFNDLYCGSGNFTLPLLVDGLSGESFEVDPHAIAALQRGARLLLGAARSPERRHQALVADARAVSERLEPRALLLANPPRAGLKLDSGSARALAACATRNIALCSCSPRSLARDLAQLLPWGFEIGQLRAFDMFPHTEHLETLAWLERR